MEVNIIRAPSPADWELAKKLTLGTVNKESIKPVDDAFKKQLIFSEHSPIYNLMVTWEWVDLPYWVSVHFVRHSVGISHYVSTQRDDRFYDYERESARQDAPVLHRCSANYESIINISRKRLCNKAHPKTKEAWQLFLTELYKYEPLLVSMCTPNCVYRNGICYEPNSCGIYKKLNIEKRGL